MERHSTLGDRPKVGHGPSEGNDPSQQYSGEPHSWWRAGLVMLACYLILHIGLASLVNDFDGWANFASNTVAIVVWGLVLVGLTFGGLVRWGLKASPEGRNRAALASTGAGAASVLAYGIYFMWTPLVVAPAALLLAHAGWMVAGSKGGRGFALIGGALGALSLAYWIICMVFVLITGSFPLPGAE